MLHKYHREEMASCMNKGQQIVYIGDSTVRQLFWATARKLDAERAYQEQHLAQKHMDLSFSYEDLSVIFIWDPYLNSSRLQTQLSSTSVPSEPGSADSTPSIILLGGGLWHARYLGNDSLPYFSEAVDNIANFMSKDHAIIPQARGPLTLLAPVQVPWYESLDQERSQTVTPARVKAMNEYLLQLYLQRGTPIAWVFSLMTFRQPAAYEPSGLHPIEDVAERMIDVILNMKCNALLMHHRRYPMDKTCCMGYPTPTWTQRISLSVLMISLPLMLLVTYRDVRKTHIPSRKITRALAGLATAVCHSYYADRTQLWNKAQKQYNFQDFVILSIATFLFGLLSIRRSRAPGTKGQSPISTKHPDQPLLSREQTDEFKGWMQFIILIYHYLGASKMLPIYEVIRLLVASYLFLTGFGHAAFFYRKEDYSLRRCAAVLIRLNMLSVILPYIMRTDYLFYYFAPLTSFWYIVVYLTMHIANQRNRSLHFLISKIIISAALINILVRTPGIFEDFFRLLERVCNVHWDAHEWRFRLQLDSYIVYIGMFCGILFIHSADVLKPTSTENSSPFKIFMRSHSRKLRSATLIFAFATPFTFYLFAKHATNKFEFNAWMPYASAPAILSYVVLRNCNRHARNYYSAIFAWMGRQSLETFTLQFHTWLAADTKGLLKTGSLDLYIGQLGEFILLSIVFLWICWRVSAATQTLTSWIVDPSTSADELEISGNEKEEVLQKPKSAEDFTSSMRMVNGVGAGVGRGANGLKIWISGNLKVRLLIILVVLWVLNMVSIASAAMPSQLMRVVDILNLDRRKLEETID